MFSLSWFTTIPGMLITGGVLLLIIALVIFIVTSKKDKKKEVESGNAAPASAVEAVNVTPTVTPNVAAASAVSVQPVVDTVQSVQPSFQAVDVATVPTTTPVEVQAQPVVDTSSQFQAAQQPVVSPVVPATPEIQVPTVMESSVGVIEQPTMPYVQTSPYSVDNNFAGVVSSPVNEVEAQPVISVAPQVESPASPIINTTTVPIVDNNIVSDNSFNVSSVIPSINNEEVSTEAFMSTPVNSDTVSIPAVENNNMGVSSFNNTQPVNQQYGPSLFENNSVVVPSVEQVVPEMQDVSAPAITNDYSVQSSPINNINNNEVVSSSIYGGAAPVVPDFTPAVESHQIYGGANPLENTQSVPIADIASGINSAPQVSNISVSQPSINQAPVINPESVVSIPSFQASIEPQIPITSTNYTAQQQSYVPEQNTAINNNFAYQNATAPQVQIPNQNM